MSTRYDPWPQGTPSWVDLSCPDPAASNEFYSALFGWEIEDTGPDMGNYGMCQVGGRPVAGIGPQMGGGDAPPAWLTYLAVDDVEKTAEAIASNGGHVVAPPMDVGAAGRMAVAHDPAGAFFGIWQAGETIGFERFNEPGSVIWNEAMSRDPNARGLLRGGVRLRLRAGRGRSPTGCSRTRPTTARSAASARWIRAYPPTCPPTG